MPTQRDLKMLLDYDKHTGILIWKHRDYSLFSDWRTYRSWNAKYAGKEAFTAVDAKGYRVGGVFGKNYHAARIIYIWVTGIDPIQVDHEDGNRQNNRWVNLRNVTGQQNQMNMKTPSNNTSGHIGVRWVEAKNKWHACIKHKGVKYHLGYFNTQDEAIAVRKQAQKDLGFHANHGR